MRVQLLKKLPVAEVLGVDLLTSRPDGINIAFLDTGFVLTGDATSVRNALALRQPDASRLSLALIQKLRQMSAQ